MPFPAISPAANSGTLALGVKSNFWDTYARQGKEEEAAFAHAFEDVDAEGDTETFAFWEAAPQAKLWRDGESASYKNMKSQNFSVVTRDWENGVVWKENTRLDDRTKSLLSIAQDAGGSFPVLRRRVYYQLYTGATNNDLLPALPNTPDGAALFSATDGNSAARFGVTGGNIISGSGVASGGAIRTNFMSTIARFLKFLNTESEPLFTESVFDGGFVIDFNAANIEVFGEAFKNDLVAIAASSATSNAAVHNIVVSAFGFKFDFRPTAYITDNDWFVTLKGARKKPLVRTRNLDPVETWISRETGSDWARDNASEGYHWKARWGFGVATPFAAIKVDN